MTIKQVLGLKKKKCYHGYASFSLVTRNFQAFL